MEPEHLARKAALARPRQKVRDPRAVRAMGLSERAGEQKGPLAFPKIAVDLFAVSRDVTFEIQNIIGDLEGEPEQIAEAIESVEILIIAIRDEGADAHWMNEAVPGGLLEHEPQVVVGPDREIVVADPAELRGLAFERLDEQVIDFVEDAQRHNWPQSFAGLAKVAHRERVH